MHFTVSIGVTTLTSGMSNLDTLLDQADQALQGEKQRPQPSLQLSRGDLRKSCFSFERRPLLANSAQSIVNVADGNRCMAVSCCLSFRC